MTAALSRMAVVLALTCFGASGAIAQDATSAPSSPTDTLSNPESGLTEAWSVIGPALPERESRPIKRKPDQGTTRLLAGKTERAGQSWTRTIGALAAVVGLIVFLGWGYRALAAGNLSLPGKLRRPGLIEIVSRTPLSARQSLCLVRIGPRLILVGQTQEALRPLDVIEDADLVARLAGRAAQEKAGSSNAEFHDCLERESREYRQLQDDVGETLAPDARRLASVQQGLSQTIRRIQRTAVQV